METWAVKTVKEKCLHRLTFCAVVAGLALLFAAINHRYIANFFSGPIIMTEAGLSSIGNASTFPHYYIRVAGSGLVDTGLEEITVTKRHGVEKDRKVSASYYALMIGRHALVVKTSRQSTLVEGALKPMPDDLWEKLDMAEAGSMVYPFYLDTGPFRTVGYWFIAVYIIILFLLLYYGLPAFRKYRNPNAVPAIKRIVSSGDPASLSGRIEKQYTQLAWWRGSGVVLSNDYIFRDTFFTFDIMQFDHLLWVYKRIIQKKINFAPAGEEYEAVLFCYEGSVNVNANEKDVDDILRKSSERAPWAVCGYSKDIEKLFFNNTIDFCRGVEARKSEIKKINR